MDFLEKGPGDLKDLMVPTEISQGFTSFDAFKKVELEKQFGSAGDGLDYHHIVEQGPNADVFPASELQSTDNIVKIPRLLHEEINSYYNTVSKCINMTTRQFLASKSFSDQKSFGLSVLRQVGLLR